MKFFTTYALISLALFSNGQENHPVNGTVDKSDGHYLFINGTIHLSADEKIENGNLEIRSGRVVDVSSNRKLIKGAVVVDLKGKHVYPSFIDLFSDYGIKTEKIPEKKSDKPQLESAKPGAFSWNDAIHSEFRANTLFAPEKKTAEPILNAGFGVVLSHRTDGIARGTGVLVDLGENANQSVLLPDAATFYSFSKGTSRQDYPSSLMGAIALLRQMYYDLEWYVREGYKDQKDLSLEGLIHTDNLPRFFDAGDYLNIERAREISDEFGLDYIIKSRGDAYKRIHEIRALNCTLVVPVHFPKPIDPTDLFETMLVSLEELKEWEMAPYNLAILESNGVRFAITADGLKNKKDFLPNLRKAIRAGLSKTQALRSLTEIPAQILGVQDEIGTLHSGKAANFLICSGELFDSSTTVYENWVRGSRFIINPEKAFDIRGTYDLKIGPSVYKLTVEGTDKKPTASIRLDTAKVNVDVQVDRKLISLAFRSKDTLSPGSYRLSGQIHYDSGLWEGKGIDPGGNWIAWTAIRSKKHTDKSKTPKTTDSLQTPFSWLPVMAYGWDSLPQPRTILIKNATVWTNEEAGILKNTSVLVRNGKIVEIANNILDTGDPNTLIINAVGKHLTCGIIDEHSHIAISGGVNEGGQAIAAEVRIGDVINPDDINLYRQLAGGVTTAQLLHGSADPIGGQSALIKLKWGHGAEELKFENAPKFIKFALGENVKQSNWGDHNTIRFPQTRMGVEQVYYDAFLRARAYNESWKAYEEAMSKKRKKEEVTAPRTDLELEALVEILESRRYITCHSYVQSEINMLMHVADSMGFTLNTFTHILEGYKLADKLKKHGAGASTFSDWWAYKYEVKDAIPYNAALLNQMGIVTAINSDDAEMGRRLNQEAAKAVTYGDCSEEDAWKMVTLNPAKLLHIDDRVGSIKKGKDADLVIWSDNPLSVYAHVEKTIIDGTVFYDNLVDFSARNRNTLERERILNKMRIAVANGETPRSAKPDKKTMYNCQQATVEP